MDDYRLTWTQEGRDSRQESAVKYSKTAAEDYAGYKRNEADVSDVQVVPAAK